MGIEDQLIDDEENKKHITFYLAEKICKRHKFITVQEYDSIYIYRDGYYSKIASPKIDAEIHRLIMSDHTGKKLSPGKRCEVIKNIEALTSVPESSINPEGVFNFKDGVYDIDSDTFCVHSEKFLTTIQFPYHYNINKECPQWLSFIESVTSGNKEKSAILQEFAGYCLTKSCDKEKSLFLIGTGSNGKSVFSETISKVFGRQNVSSVSLEGLANPVLRCNIINKFINIDSDLPRNAEKFEEVFRKIVSGEPIQFNEKFCPAYTTSPTCKLMYCLNEFPTIDDASNAFYRRMLLVPFDVEFNDTNKDTSLKHRLEFELAGIFRWCVDGYRRLKQHGFTKASFMDSEIREIKTDNNPIIAFVDYEIEFDGSLSGITKKDLYKKYTEWVKDNGHKPLSFRKFNNRFYNLFKKHTIKDAQLTYGSRDHIWPGVKLRESSIGWTE